MALPYELVRGLMVLEMLTFVLLILPLPMAWRKKVLLSLSQSSTPKTLKKVHQIVMVLVVILFADSLARSFRTTYYHQHPDRDFLKDSHADSHLHARMFYAQRNMYLTGFTLFLSLILRSFIRSLVDILLVEEKMEVLKKQAGGQTKEYLRLVEQNDDKGTQIASLEKELAALRKTVTSSEAVLKQAKAQQEEYLRLSDRYNELEKKFEQREHESKKEL